jgi:hypothetical protein
MNDSPFPKTSTSRFTGKSGLNRTASIINDDLRWIFRKVDQEDDYGIDGFADIVSDTGDVTGQSFALQIKYGDSYFSNENEFSTPYYGKSKHLNFYCNIPNPVLIVVGRPGSPLYWQMFEVGETERTPSGWSLDIPKRNIFDASARNALLKIIGSPTDAAREAAEHWEFTENLAATTVVLYYIDPSDINSNNIDNISSFIDRLTRTSSAARKSQGKLELFRDLYTCLTHRANAAVNVHGG